MRKPRICVVYREYDAEFVYVLAKDVMQGQLFQKCRHLLYCSVRLWAVMKTQDGCQSLTWDPSFT